jgi:hypothetical protein
MTDDAYHDIDSARPETAAEALARWDDGKTVWTVEMGGLGPGYEQAIHVTAFELIREALALDSRPIDSKGDDLWQAFGERLDKEPHPWMHDLGITGAQTQKLLGMYHCPDCGAMVLGGIVHPQMCRSCIERRHPRFDKERP